MDNKERKAYLNAKLRNLKRKYAKLSQHADLVDEYEEIDREIKAIEHELTLI